MHNINVRINNNITVTSDLDWKEASVIPLFKRIREINQIITNQ